MRWSWLTTAAGVGASLLLTGCAANRASSPELALPANIAQQVKASNAALAKVSVQEAAAHYAGFTVKTFSRAHGTQVEYFDRTGRCYLWYPGNRKINPCLWKIEKRASKSPIKSLSGTSVVHICFSYSANSRNPVTGHTGGGWQCKRALATRRDQSGGVSYFIPPPGFSPSTADKAQGDVFGLKARKNVPFILDKKPHTFDALRQRL